MTPTNRIYQVEFTGIHARGDFEGRSFTGTGYMELEDGKEYIYAKWKNGKKMCFQQIVPGSMTMRFEEFIDDRFNDRSPLPTSNLKENSEKSPLPASPC